MKIINKIDEMRQTSWQLKKNNKTIAFVPTMGNLHDGHLSLVQLAKQHADIVIVSIFVNPSQFGPSEDYHSYPRTLETDQKLLADNNHVDYLFYPNAEDIFINNTVTTRIHPSNLETLLCGKTRPQFFSGVSTIVSILFNATLPDIAVFGEKDYQQLIVIKQLVRDLHYDIKIISAPIVREASGLAMSSRNNYLTNDQRLVAAEIFKILNEACNEIKLIIQNKSTTTEINTDNILNNYKIKLNNLKLQVDYLSLCNSRDLSNIETISPNLKETHHELVLLVAVYLDKTRLIDNIKFYLD